MIHPGEISEIMSYARDGNLPPLGDVATAQELIGFSFGTHFGPDGQVSHPTGVANSALAHFIVHDKVLRELPMTLQEEVAWEVKYLDPTLTDRIDAMPTNKAPGKAYNTHEVLWQARPGLIKRGVGSLAVVAFRYHLPRAAAEVHKAGFQVSTPDLSQVGDFPPHSSQPWTTNASEWIRRERKVILASAVLGYIGGRPRRLR